MKNAINTMTHQKDKKKKKKKLSIQDLSWSCEDENITIKIWEYVMADVRGRAKIAMVSKSMNAFWRLGSGKGVITSAEDLVEKYYNMDPKTTVSRRHIEAPSSTYNGANSFNYKMIWSAAILYRAVPEWRFRHHESNTFTISLADFCSRVIKQSEHEKESGWNEKLFKKARLIARERRQKVAERELAAAKKREKIHKRDRAASSRLEKTLIPKMRALLKEHIKKVTKTKGGVVQVCKRLRKEITVWETEFSNLGKLHSLPLNNGNLDDDEVDESGEESESYNSDSSSDDDEEDDDESN